MSIPEEERDFASRLRERAEDALRGNPIDLAGLPIEDIQALLHELQVHQVELTLQNEELRRAQLDLEITRDQYSDLYNFAPVGYCTLDRKGRILEANQTLAVLLVIDQKKLIHKKLSDFIVREDQDDYYLHVQSTFEDRQRQVVDIQMVKTTTEKMAVRLEIALDHEDQSRLRIILSDITNQKQVQKELQLYTQELERANQALRDFSFIVSHDLQEPLRKIKAFGKLMETRFDDTLGAEGKDYIARMDSAANRMDSMLRGLLAYSRVSSKGVSFFDVNLSEIALAVLSDMDSRLMETGGTVSLVNLPNIQADPLQMRQLFQNLIGNALKYHRPGVPPLVTVTSSLIEDRWIEIMVNDNGVGIDMQYADYIFEPFTRLDVKSDTDGTGMGLVICKKIIEHHGGTISVSSMLDQGSTFTVKLPAQRG
jgi:two-component system, chemotaxis family, sensor kinase Cph1